MTAAFGDALILLTFAAIGRANHGDREGGFIQGILGTAAPFLIGWFVMAALLGALHADAFVSARDAAKRTARVWLPGGILGLALRSVIEHHLTPLPFVIIALGFNLILLVAWHAALARLIASGRLSAPTQIVPSLR